MTGLAHADAKGQPLHEVAEMMALGAELTTNIEGNDLIIPGAESGTMEIHFGYIGDQRKQLVKSIGEFTGQPPVYQNAPSFAYRIGDYKIDKRGTLTGPNNHTLMQWLKDEGFEVK